MKLRSFALLVLGILGSVAVSRAAANRTRLRIDARCGASACGGARVTLTQGEHWPVVVMLDAHGSATVDGLEPGTAHVVVEQFDVPLTSAERSSSDVISYTAKDRAILKSRGVDPPEPTFAIENDVWLVAQQATTVDLVAPATGGASSIEGVVVDDRGRPQKGASIQASCALTRRSRRTAADGRFRLERLPAGPCFVSASLWYSQGQEVTSPASIRFVFSRQPALSRR